MLSCKITIVSGLVLRVVISTSEEGGVSVGGEGGGEVWYIIRMLNVTFSPTETDI